MVSHMAPLKMESICFGGRPAIADAAHRNYLFFVYASGSLISSGFSFAILTNSSMQGGQQNSYALPPMTQVNVGLALVCVTGQIFSPDRGRKTCFALSPLNFSEAVILPFTLMSALVYLPPGVR